jgi:hypothetical protein
MMTSKSMIVIAGVASALWLGACGDDDPAALGPGGVAVGNATGGPAGAGAAPANSTGAAPTNPATGAAGTGSSPFSPGSEVGNLGGAGTGQNPAGQPDSFNPIGTDAANGVNAGAAGSAAIPGSGPVPGGI